MTTYVVETKAMNRAYEQWKADREAAQAEQVADGTAAHEEAEEAKLTAAVVTFFERVPNTGPAGVYELADPAELTAQGKVEADTIRYLAEPPTISGVCRFCLVAHEGYCPEESE